MSHVPLPDELSDPERKLNPFPWFERMRESEPVRFDPSRDAWDVFKYDHVSEVLSNHHAYSSDVMGDHVGPLAESMTFSDPPRHDFLREAAVGFFKPSIVDDYESHVRAETVDRIETHAPTGTLDVMNDLGFPVTVTTIAALQGVPPEDHDRFLEYASKALRGRTLDGTPVQNSRKYKDELVSYFTELVEKRQQNPRDDLVSHLLETSVDGRSLTHEDVVANCQMMMVGGTSSATLLTNAIYSFSQVDGLANELAGDRQAIESAIEETLRYRSSTLALPRIAKTDVELAGRQIEKGDRLMAWVASANRDEAVFDRPESFVYDREDNDHLTFGEGIHYCIGTRVARMEARVVLSELLDRLADVDVCEREAEPHVNPVEFGFESLPIQFDRRGN